MAKYRRQSVFLLVAPAAPVTVLRRGNSTGRGYSKHSVITIAARLRIPRRSGLHRIYRGHAAMSALVRERRSITVADQNRAREIVVHGRHFILGDQQSLV